MSRWAEEIEEVIVRYVWACMGMRICLYIYICMHLRINLSFFLTYGMSWFHLGYIYIFFLKKIEVESGHALLIGLIHHSYVKLVFAVFS